MKIQFSLSVKDKKKGLCYHNLEFGLSLGGNCTVKMSNKCLCFISHERQSETVLESGSAEIFR